MNTTTQPVLLRSQPNKAGDITSAWRPAMDRPGESPGTPSKQCSQCRDTKPIDSFSRSGKGRRSACKECRNARDRQTYSADVDKSRAIERQKYAANPGARKATVNRWYAANPERASTAKRARKLVYEAIRRGDLMRPNQCSKCGDSSVAIEAAHADYTKPLDIKWLCRPCHRAWDREDPKTRRHPLFTPAPAQDTQEP